VNTAAPHFGEESCIQGVNGSGTIFFSGCNLRCVFCQVYQFKKYAYTIELEYRTQGGWISFDATRNRGLDVETPKPGRMS